MKCACLSSNSSVRVPVVDSFCSKSSYVGFCQPSSIKNSMTIFERATFSLTTFISGR